jgi:molybdenum-dependent DNA-binding transcriptional regulator ModE
MTPPPPLDEDGNLLVDENASITETSMTPIVEELMKKIEKLNSELSKLKTKDKKDKKNTSTSDDDDSSYEEEASNTAKKGQEKM